MSSRSNTPRIYIGNLPQDVKETEIEELFSKYGRVRDIDVKYGRTANGTAYAFVEFEDSRDAEEAVDAEHGCKFGGTRLRVEFTGGRRPKRNVGKSSGPPKRTKYRVKITDLPKSASWQDLKDHMRQAGSVGYANVKNGVGFVEYMDAHDMDWAIRNLDGSEFKNIFQRCWITVTADPEYGGRSRTPVRDHHRDRYSSRSRSHCNGGSFRRSRSYGRRRTSDSNRNECYYGEVERSPRRGDRLLEDIASPRDSRHNRTPVDRSPSMRRGHSYEAADGGNGMSLRGRSHSSCDFNAGDGNGRIRDPSMERLREEDGHDKHDDVYGEDIQDRTPPHRRRSEIECR